MSIGEVGAQINYASAQLPVETAEQAAEILTASCEALAGTFEGNNSERAAQTLASLNTAISKVQEAGSNLETAQEHLRKYLGEIGVQSDLGATAAATRQLSERRKEMPPPVYKPGVYAITPYRVQVQTKDSTIKTADVIDISWEHTPENAPEVAAVIKAHGCGTVAVELSELHTPEEVSELEAEVNNIVNCSASPEDRAKFDEKYSRASISKLTVSLQGSGIQVKIIDSPVPAEIDRDARTMITNINQFGLALREVDIPEAIDLLDIAFGWIHHSTNSRDENMARQVAGLIKQAIDTKNTRPIAVLKGAFHYQVLQKVPGATGKPDMAAISSIMPYNLVNIREVRESHGSLLAYRTEINRGVVAGLITSLLNESVDRTQDFVQNLGPEQLEAVLDSVHKIMQPSRELTPYAEKKDQARTYLADWQKRLQPQA